MAGTLKFSGITMAGSAPAADDMAVGISAEGQVLRYTFEQIGERVAPFATADSPGIVQPDGATIEISSGGVIRAVGGGLTVNAPVTPFSGGGWQNATQTGYGVTVVHAAGAPDDSVQLPPAVAGSLVILVPDASGGYNSWVDNVAVFPKYGTTDTINGNAGGPVDPPTTDSMDFGPFPTITVPVPAFFVCHTDGAWLANTYPGN